MTGRISVHWNLQRGGYSVTLDKKRVIAKPDAVCLTNVRFVVSAAQLRRMRGLGRRKVVAWIEGDVCPCHGPLSDGVEITFNPWRADTFHERGTGRPVRTASHVSLTMRTGPDGVRTPLTLACDARD